MPELVYLNGRISTFDEAFVSVNDRGYIFGDGVYEVIRAYGGTLFALDDHLKRLEKSAGDVDMNMPCKRDELKVITRDVTARSGFDEAIVYMQVTRGVAPRNHLFDSGLQPNLLITVRDFTGKYSAAFYEQGVAVITMPEIRWQMRHVKSISLHGAVMAVHRARQAKAVEAVFYLPDETVTECASSNIFIYKDGVLKTHPADHNILAGVTRKHVLELAGLLTVPASEEPFNRSELLAAEEVFFTGTGCEIVPVVAVDGSAVGKGEPGDLTIGLMREFSSLVRRNR